MRADPDLRVDLDSAIEIASLRDTVERVLHVPWDDRVEPQQIPIELLNETFETRALRAKRAAGPPRRSVDRPPEGRDGSSLPFALALRTIRARA